MHAGERRAIIFMNFFGKRMGDSECRRPLPWSGLKSGPETARVTEKGKTFDA
jgi:hypothetical protein